MNDRNRISPSPAADDNTSFVALFTPKLITILREGYGWADLRADISAGLTVAVVALPLSMAIAIASGVGPERGLYTSIIGGFFVSLLGGSRFQVGGPAGAFIVLVAACVARSGIEGLLLAVIGAGIIMVVAGFLRLGSYVKFIPYPVTVGFTAGIAAIIIASQLGDLLGLTFAHGEPAAVLPKIMAISTALPSTNISAILLAIFTVATIVLVKRFRPKWPKLLVALVLATIAAMVLGIHVETIGSRFGEIPATMPLPSLPTLSVAKIQAALPDAFAFALLGAVESLLSATVADGMTGRRHRSNCELVAQGVANIFSGLLGGIPVTGLIARTATNIRAGARGPIAGIIHAFFILAFMLIAAPLAYFIPLSVLAAILVYVAWQMIERQALATLLTSARGDAIVLLSTLLLTIFRDVATGILVGFGMGTLLFLSRMAKNIGIEGVPLVAPDTPDGSRDVRTPYDAALAADPSRVVYRISGAFFFGAASTVGAVLDRIAVKPKLFILDFAAVPYLDSTAANTIRSFARNAAKRDVKMVITGTAPSVHAVLSAHGVAPPDVAFSDTIATALAQEDAIEAQQTGDAG